MISVNCTECQLDHTDFPGVDEDVENCFVCGGDLEFSFKEQAPEGQTSTSAFDEDELKKIIAGVQSALEALKKGQF